MRAREGAEYQKAVGIVLQRLFRVLLPGLLCCPVIFLVMIWRDVTRSNRYRRQLEEANRFAEELLASREKLMLAITHDFKAPLGSIMGYADLLSRLTVDGRQRFLSRQHENFFGTPAEARYRLARLPSPRLE